MGITEMKMLSLEGIDLELNFRKLEKGSHQSKICLEKID